MAKRKPTKRGRPAPRVRSAELAPVDSLRPHPRNYKTHPEDQLAHIRESLQQHGFYRNVVVAREGTILAGHGVWTAAKQLGIRAVPVVRLPISPDDPRALKVLVSDNELGRFSEDDDRLLSEVLKSIRDEDERGLVGTGYDDQMLAALVMTTRPAGEIADFDAAREWVGMPEYHADDGPLLRIVVTFRNEKDRQRFIREHGIKVDGTRGQTLSARWPHTEREDVSSVRFRKAAP